jgi:hypothetical protein
MIPLDLHAVDEVLAGFQTWARKQAGYMDETGLPRFEYTGTKRPPPKMKKQMSFARGRYYDRITLTTPWGAKRVVNIHILPADVATCCAGQFQLLSKKDKTYVVSVFFPLSMPPEQLADDRVALKLRGALLHELTHGVDKIQTLEERFTGVLSRVRGIRVTQAKKAVKEIGEKLPEVLIQEPERVARAAGVSLGRVQKAREMLIKTHEQSPEGTAYYYNQPHEIRAFLRMIYEEVRPVVAMLRKRRPNEGLAGRIEAALLFSEIWNWDIYSGGARRAIRFPAPIQEKLMMSREKPKPYHEYLTLKNRNYILKKLYQALSKVD